ncbi:MAG: UDP-N-acetylmuramoyl-L-alanyl-D-glutamate--2,6-diaminopimelate ligase [Candidatus Eremiobacteraeota bacterium]|nr:UDP-N-acetylmuramoyl-L-alanyl-D-glutamate--2,6-diaminopimelate ligase [Candidatus Eremiobacteraeota bacterium]
MNVSSAGIVDALRKAGLLREIVGELPGEFSSISSDTRGVIPGGLFVAVKGAVRDGHEFIGQAFERGSSAAIVGEPDDPHRPLIVVNNTRRAAATAAAVAYEWPARKLRFIGVTGTNGKTTTVSIIRHLLNCPDTPAASVGTLGVLDGAGHPLPGGDGLTTPGPIELQRLLRQLVDLGVKIVAMEVSSHSLDQHRVEGVTFDAAVYTNLTRDHLDYHRTMEAYFAAKAKLIPLLSSEGTAIINADAEEWSQLPAAPKQLTYGIAAKADVMAEDTRIDAAGSHWMLSARGERAPVALPLIGAVNVQNALAAAATALALGVTVEDCAQRLTSLPQVPGRLERIASDPAVLRDYAHTPDALERTLGSARQLTNGKLIVVFGCGGERDRGKRPLMGAVAEKLSDVAIVTSDNPRREDPDEIINEIEAGMTMNNHERVTDRRAAIERALAIAGPDDLVVLAGKGHETYQIRGTQSFPFDERDIVREIREARVG